MMITLKQALETGNLSQFIKEHEAAPKGDSDAFNRTVTSMAQTSKEAPASSQKRNRDG